MSTRRLVLEAAASRVLSQLEDLYAREAELDQKYGAEDQFKEGDVITFSYQFVKGGRKYSYAAILTPSTLGGLVWSTTGPKSPKAFTWNELREWFERGKVTKLKVVTARKTIL